MAGGGTTLADARGSVAGAIFGVRGWFLLGLLGLPRGSRDGYVLCFQSMLGYFQHIWGEGGRQKKRARLDWRQYKPSFLHYINLSSLAAGVVTACC